MRLNSKLRAEYCDQIIDKTIEFIEQLQSEYSKKSNKQVTIIYNIDQIEFSDPINQF